MCVRYQKGTERLVLWSRAVDAWVYYDDWQAGDDTYPGYEAPIITVDWERGPLRPVRAQWGLTPAWAKDANFGRKFAYNARCETLLEKPTWRTAMRKHRCIVPANAFYERSEGRWIRFTAVAPAVPFAGLYEPPNAHCALPTFAIVTTEPNELITPFQDRMPVVLADADMARWLDPEAGMDELRSLLVPAPPDWFTVEDAGPIRPEKPRASASLFED